MMVIKEKNLRNKNEKSLIILSAILSAIFTIALLYSTIELPHILNNTVTTIAIISIVSLEFFIKKPFYSMCTYGPILWSFYHIFLFLLVLHFLKKENESLKEIIGSLKNKMLHSIFIVFGLIGLSVIMFQIIEPIVSDMIYGFGAMKQMINEYKEVSLFFVLYTILITSLTAGIFEEIIWRGVCSD